MFKRKKQIKNYYESHFHFASHKWFSFIKFNYFQKP